MNKKISMTRNVSRRTFLGSSAASAFSFNFFPLESIWSKRAFASCGIGVGGKGKGDFDGLAMHGDVVAACDIDERET